MNREVSELYRTSDIYLNIQSNVEGVEVIEPDGVVIDQLVFFTDNENDTVVVNNPINLREVVNHQFVYRIPADTLQKLHPGVLFCKVVYSYPVKESSLIRLSYLH